MESLSGLVRLLAYDAWANEAYLCALSALESPPAGATRVMGHIIGAKKLWLARLTKDGAKVEVWPAFERSAWTAAFLELSQKWRRFEEALTVGQLSSPVSYQNSKGEPWTSTVGDVLMHVALHGAYHRGQLARELRQAGVTPPYTDYIHAVRQGLVL
jgi:uncharacterized damage-inducible protein DinB